MANPGALFGVPGYPWGTSRPGPDLYTDSVVKLSPTGKLLWYYQLTPHDLYDWDMQNSPVLSTARRAPVVIDGGKAGILIELNAQTGKLLWKLPVGLHNGHDHDGLLTENAKPTSRIKLPRQFCLEPGLRRHRNPAGLQRLDHLRRRQRPAGAEAGRDRLLDTSPPLDAVLPGELVAVDQATGQGEWDTKLPYSPYGGVTLANNVVFTTTYNGTCTRSTRPPARSC